MNTRLTTLLALILSLFTCASASAESWPDISNSPGNLEPAPFDYAVIVAPEDYAHIADIPGSRRAASDWRAFFKKSLRLPSSRIQALTGVDAKPSKIRKALDKAVEETDAQGRVWFIFIGHGISLPDPETKDPTGYLMGVNATQDAEEIPNESISSVELISKLNAGSQKDSVVVLDSCFSGLDHTGSTLMGDDAMPGIPVKKIIGMQKTAVFSASKGGQFAGGLPGARRPAFSYILLGALQGWARPQNKDVITATDAQLFVDEAFYALGNNPYHGRIQTPQYSGAQDLVMVRGRGNAEPGKMSIAEYMATMTAKPDRTAAVATLVPSALTLVGGGALTTLGYLKARDANAAYAAGDTPEAVIADDIKAANRISTGGVVAMGLGAAGLITGIVLWKTAKIKTDADTKPSVFLTPTGVGVHARF